MHFTDSIAFVEYSNNMDDIYKNIEEYNLDKKRKILIVFDGMVADMLNNKKQRYTSGRKLNISFAFIS